MSDTIFGWELTYKTVESSLTNNADVLIAFAHLFLLKNKMKCIGIGDEKSLTDADKENQSELLPEGWNQMNGVYKLRYICDNKLYILHATLCDDLLIINLLDIETLKLSNVAFPLNDTVLGNVSSSSAAIKNIHEVWDKLKLDLLEPVFQGTQTSTQTQTEQKERTDNALVVERRRPPEYRDPINPLIDRRFPDVGRGDLDPFGRGSGNLLPGPGIGPRRSFPPPFGVPPGARFDPFGPVGPPPNRFEPNPDHFRPPDYDDMFM